MVGGVMGKLLVVLLLGLYLTLQLGGNDPGHLRPGLANAVAETAAPVAIVAPIQTQRLVTADEPATRATKPVRATSSDSLMAGSAKPAPPRADVVAVAYSPDPAPAAPQHQAEKVFTLSALPGQQNAPDTSLPQGQTEAAAPAPEVWYVTGRSVNVRLDPSTDAPIVGKLLRGDAALVLADTGAGWVRVSVEGDGVTGYVSTDFLSPTAP